MSPAQEMLKENSNFVRTGPRGLDSHSRTNFEMKTLVSDEKKKDAIVDVGDAPLETTSTNEEMTLPDAKYLSGLPLIFVSLALMSGVFMIALDNSIISTAIPKITSQFTSLNDVGWYGSAYLLTQMALQPTFGKFYTYFNLKWTYICALVVFEVGSVICAAAPSSMAFIIGRAVAGVGASGIFCGGLVILAHTVEMKKRPLFMAIVSSMYGIASVIGPTLGGLMTDSARLTWRFCFWVNLPFGGIALLVVMIVFKPVPAVHSNLSIRQKLSNSGFAGAIILIGATTCLVLALQWGGAVYPWSDSRVWGLLLGFGLLAVLFIIMQIQQKEGALIPPRIFSQRSVFASCLFTMFMQISMMAQAYYIPFFFQAVQGTTAKVSGLNILPYGITITIATLVGGALITFSGFYVPFMWFGAGIFAAGSGLLHTLVRSSPMKEWFGYQVLAGIGYGVGVQVPFFAVQVVLSTTDIPIASALIAFFQCLGGTVGVAIAQNIFQNSLVDSLEQIPGIDVPTVVAAGGAGIAGAVSAHQLGPVRDAYNIAITTAFLVAVCAAGAAFLTSLGMEWRKIPSTKKTENLAEPTVKEAV